MGKKKKEIIFYKPLKMGKKGVIWGVWACGASDSTCR